MPPGSTVSVQVPQRRVAASVQSNVDSPAGASTYMLRQIDMLLPDENLAAQVYSTLTQCGYSVGMSLGGLPEVLGCAATRAGAFSQVAKKALESTTFVGTYLADSLRGNIEGRGERLPDLPLPGCATSWRRGKRRSRSRRKHRRDGQDDRSAMAPAQRHGRQLA